MENPTPGQVLKLYSAQRPDGSWVLAADLFTPTDKDPLRITTGRVLGPSDGGEGAIRFVPDSDLAPAGAALVA